MTAAPIAAEQLTAAWRQQRIWSLTADRLKQRLDQARQAALALGVAAAVLAVAASQLTDRSPGGGRVLSGGAALCAGLATFAQRRVGTEQIRTWTRARSTSEALKTQIYSYLAGGRSYPHGARDQCLAAAARRLIEQVDDLQRHTLGITPDSKPLPAVHNLGSYITVRVNGQIDSYYTPRAATYQQRVRRLRAAQDLLGVLAVVLAAVAAATAVGSFSVWVPVVTTVGASLAAHLTAARYDHLVIEYLRTAQRLTHLRDEHQGSPTAQANSAFIDACEEVISIENQGWMARWKEPHDTGAAT